MIIDELYLKSISVVPLKTDSVAIVYANAVLSCSVGAKSFELIAGRHLQVVEGHSRIKDCELLKRPQT